MQIFKNKKILNIITFICILLIGEFVLTITLEPTSYANYFNHDIKVIEETDADVNMIFVGASRVYRSFVPGIFEEKLGMDTVINAGSSSQSISGSYYQLKELLNKFEPSYVVLGVTGDALWGEYYTQANLIVSDRLHGYNRLSYVFDVFKPEDYPYFFLNSYRFRNNLSPRAIINNIKSKTKLISDKYKDDSSKLEYYCDTGFVYSNAAYIAGNVEIKSPIEANREMNLGELQYLDKMVELCHNKNITLYLVTAPTTMMRIYNSPDYEYAHKWYADYAEKHNLIYRNLNLLKHRETLIPDTLMHDYNHLNGEGAMVISDIYADILKADMSGKSVDEYFHTSLDELDVEVNRVIAVKADIEEKNSTLIIDVDSLHSERYTPQYSVHISNGSEEYKTVVEWTSDTSFIIDVSEYKDYSVMVRARIGILGEAEAFQCYSF